MKDRVKIVLLDFDPTTPLATNLQSILRSSNPPVELLRESVDGASISENDLASLVSGFSPDVVFLILSPSLLKNVRELCSATIRSIGAVGRNLVLLF